MLRLIQIKPWRCSLSSWMIGSVLLHNVRLCADAMPAAAQPKPEMGIVVLWTRPIAVINKCLSEKKQGNTGSTPNAHQGIRTDAFDLFLKSLEHLQGAPDGATGKQQQIVARQAIDLLALCFIFRRSEAQPSQQTLRRVVHECLGRLAATPDEIAQQLPPIDHVALSRAIAVAAEPTELAAYPKQQIGFARLMRLATIHELPKHLPSVLLVLPRLASLGKELHLNPDSSGPLWPSFVALLTECAKQMVRNESTLVKSVPLSLSLAKGLIATLRFLSAKRVELLASKEYAVVASESFPPVSVRQLSIIIEGAEVSLRNVAKRKGSPELVLMLIEAAGLVRDICAADAKRSKVALSKNALRILNAAAPATAFHVRRENLLDVVRAFHALQLNPSPVKTITGLLTAAASLPESLDLLTVFSPSPSDEELQPLAAARPLVIVAVSRALANCKSLAELAKVGTHPQLAEVRQVAIRAALSLVPSSTDASVQLSEDEVRCAADALLSLTRLGGAVPEQQQFAKVTQAFVERYTDRLTASQRLLGASCGLLDAKAVVDELRHSGSLLDTTSISPVQMAHLAEKVATTDEALANSMAIAILSGISERLKAAGGSTMEIAKALKSLLLSPKDVMPLLTVIGFVALRADSSGASLRDHHMLLKALLMRCMIDKNSLELCQGIAVLSHLEYRCDNSSLELCDPEFRRAFVVRGCSLLAANRETIPDREYVQAVQSAAIAAVRFQIHRDARVAAAMVTAAEACLTITEEKHVLSLSEVLVAVPETRRLASRLAALVLRYVPVPRSDAEKDTVWALRIIAKGGVVGAEKCWRSVGEFADEIAWNLHHDYSLNLLCSLLRVLSIVRPPGATRAEDRIAATVVCKADALSSRNLFDCLDGARYSVRQGLTARGLRARALSLLSDPSNRAEAATILAPVLAACYAGDTEVWSAVRCAWTEERNIPDEVVAQFHTAGVSWLLASSPFQRA